MFSDSQPLDNTMLVKGSESVWHPRYFLLLSKILPTGFYALTPLTITDKYEIYVLMGPWLAGKCKLICVINEVWDGDNNWNGFLCMSNVSPYTYQGAWMLTQTKTCLKGIKSDILFSLNQKLYL